MQTGHQIPFGLGSNPLISEFPVPYHDSYRIQAEFGTNDHQLTPRITGLHSEQFEFEWCRWNQWLGHTLIINS